MRPLLLIGITVLLLCAAGCTSHIGKRINDCNTSETTVPQQNATQEAKTEQAAPLIANAPSGTSILIRKSEFRLYLLVNGNVVQS